MSESRHLRSVSDLYAADEIEVLLLEEIRDLEPPPAAYSRPEDIQDFEIGTSIVGDSSPSLSCIYLYIYIYIMYVCARLCLIFRAPSVISMPKAHYSFHSGLSLSFSPFSLWLSIFTGFRGTGCRWHS